MDKYGIHIIEEPRRPNPAMQLSKVGSFTIGDSSAIDQDQEPCCHPRVVPIDSTKSFCTACCNYVARK